MKKIESIVFWGCWLFGTYLISDSQINAAINDETSVSTAPDENTPVPINLQSLSPEDKKEFFESFDTIMSDCDGVLYSGKEVKQNAHRAVDELRKRGKTIYFVTNTKRAKREVMKRFKELGFVNIDDDSVISSGDLLVNYLRDRMPADKVVYLIGPQYACDGLLEHNIGCFGSGRDDMDLNSFKDIHNAHQYKTRNNVGAVVITIDMQFNYNKLVKAFMYLQDEHCLFLTIGTENLLPTGSGTSLPGGRAIVAAVKEATGRDPVMLDKPGSYLAEILKRMSDPQRTLFVGDRLDTDVLLGHKCSFRTVLVLTGLQTLRDVEKYAKSDDPEKKKYVPDYYTDAFSDLAFM